MIGLIVFGMILRVWGLNFGLPYSFHQDEPVVINHALAYGTGDFNPHFFVIPPLVSYILFFGYGVFFLLGRIFGIFASVQDFALKFFLDPTAFYLIARVILGVLPGTKIIGLTYLLYKKNFGKSGALFAALLMASNYLSVANAHYAYADNWMVVFVLSTYLALSCMMQEPWLKNYIKSAVMLGLAVSAKYNAALLGLSFWVAHTNVVIQRKGKAKEVLFDHYLWIAFGGAILIFLITNPFAVLDTGFFLNQVLHKIRSGYMGWTYHIFYSLKEGIGPLFTIAGLLGFAFIFKKESLKKGLFFISFPLAFYLHLSLKSQPFSRYALALVPFLAITSSFLLFKILSASARNLFAKISVILIGALLFIPTFAKTLKSDILFSGPDTRTISAKWIEDNLPPYTKIAVDHTSFRPQIIQTKEQLMEKFDLIGNQEGLKNLKKDKIRLQLMAIENKKTYTIYFLSSDDTQDIEFVSMAPAIPYNLNNLIQMGVEYVVINYNLTDDKKNAFIHELSQKGVLVAQFSPYYDQKIRYPYDMIDMTCMSVGSQEIFSRAMTGPSLVIYKIKAIKE